MHYQPFQGQKKLIVNWRVSQYLKIKLNEITKKKKIYKKLIVVYLERMYHFCCSNRNLNKTLVSGLLFMD